MNKLRSMSAGRQLSIYFLITKSILFEPEKSEYSLYDALMNPAVSLMSVIMKSSVPGLDVVISRISMAKLEPSLLGQIDGHFRLKEHLAQVKGRYDFVLIDTPPTLGLITLNSLVAAT